MLRKFALATAVLSVAASQFVSTASAETVVTNKIDVSVYTDATDLCLVAPNLLSFRLKFWATVDTFNVTPPSKIRVAYQAVDKTTKWTIGSRALNLKKSKGYMGKSRRITAEAGHRLSYRVKMSYRALGKTIRAYKAYPDKVPSEAEMVGLPYC